MNVMSRLATNSTDPLKVINDYISSIDGVDEYVVVLDGYPLYWGKNIDQEKAEELAALATDMINSYHGYSATSGEEYVIISTETPSNYTGAARLKPNLFLLVRGKPSIVRTILLNVYRRFNNRLTCPWCGGDLSLHVVKCGNNHSLPVGLDTCPICGSRIEYFKCPHCGRPVDPHGNKVVLRTPRENIILSLIIMAATIALIGIAVKTYHKLSLLSIITLASSTLFFALSFSLLYSGLKKKQPVKLRK